MQRSILLSSILHSFKKMGGIPDISEITTQSDVTDVYGNVGCVEFSFREERHHTLTSYNRSEMSVTQVVIVLKFMLLDLYVVCKRIHPILRYISLYAYFALLTFESM